MTPTPSGKNGLRAGGAADMMRLPLSSIPATMFSRHISLTLPTLLVPFAFAAALAAIPAQAQQAATTGIAKTQAKIDPLTTEKKRAVDAFIESLELEATWPEFIDLAEQSMVDQVRAGIVEGAELDKLPADKRAKVDAVIDDMIPHIVEDLKAEFLKIDVPSLYRAMGYEVYGKNFTTRELKELSAIYAAPAYRRAMPAIVDLRKANPQATDDDLRKAIGNDNFNHMVKYMRSRAYVKLLTLTPALQEAANQYLGAAIEGAGERVGRQYGPILLARIKAVLEQDQESAPAKVEAGIQAPDHAAAPQGNAKDLVQ